MVVRADQGSGEVTIMEGNSPRVPEAIGVKYSRVGRQSQDSTSRFTGSVRQETAETAGGSEEWGKDTDALYTVYDGTQGGGDQEIPVRLYE
jgi:hypothetical protein